MFLFFERAGGMCFTVSSGFWLVFFHDNGKEKQERIQNFSLGFKNTVVILRRDSSPYVPIPGI